MAPSVAAPLEKTIIGTETGPLLRPPRPNQETYMTSLNKLNERIENLKKKKNGLRDQLSATTPEKQKFQAAKTTIRARIEEVKSEQKKFQEDRTILLDQIKQIQDSMKKKLDDAKAAKDKMPFKSVAEADRRIQCVHLKNLYDFVRELDALVSTGTMKLIEEKRLLSEISAIRKQRKVIESMNPVDSSMVTEKTRVDECRAKLTLLNSSAPDFRLQLDVLFTELRSVMELRDGVAASNKSVFDDTDAVMKELVDAFAEKDVLMSTHRIARDAYGEYERTERARRADEKKARDAELARERKVEAVRRAKDDAEVPAYQHEIAVCRALENILKPYMLEEVVAVEKENVVQKASPDGLTLVPKKSERKNNENYAYFPKKQKSASKKQSSTSSITFDLGVMEQFWSLKLMPPASVAAVGKAHEDLELKLKFYLENQARATLENMTKASKMEERLNAELKALELSSQTVEQSGDANEKVLTNSAAADASV